jgi:hypothetical protein
MLSKKKKKKRKKKRQGLAVHLRGRSQLFVGKLHFERLHLFPTYNTDSADGIISLAFSACEACTDLANGRRVVSLLMLGMAVHRSHPRSLQRLQDAR